MVTSGSRAAPSRGAAAHPCCFRDHVRLGSHDLWPLLSPGTVRGLLGGSRTGVNADYWLSCPPGSSLEAVTRELRRSRPCWLGICCANLGRRETAGLGLLERDPPQMSHFSFSSGYWRGYWRRPPSRSGLAPSLSRCEAWGGPGPPIRTAGSAPSSLAASSTTNQLDGVQYGGRRQ
jgi:hypothetical protein